MKERNLLYFITAVVVTLLFLSAIIIRTLVWFSTYGDFVSPGIYQLLIPLVLLWVGWYFEEFGFLLGASIILSVLIGLQFNSLGILSGDIFVVSRYQPIIRTSFVFSLLLMIPANALGYYTYFKNSQNSKTN